MDEMIICSWNDLLTAVKAIQQLSKAGLWFRGQGDHTWKLPPSVQRKEYRHRKTEQYMATNFMIETRRRKQDAPGPYNRAAWLELMQHYGLPTRMLDWSQSPLVALYFALSSKSKGDAALWVLNPTALNVRMQFKDYLYPLDYSTVRPLLRGAFNDQIKPTNKVIACCGVGHDLRVFVQQSNFTVHDTDVPLDALIGMGELLWRIRLPAEYKEGLLKDIDILGVHESTIYPDMEHIASEQRAMFGGTRF